MANEGGNVWALLIGINEYKSPGLKTLYGCVNDVQAMERFLMNQMNVPDRQIKVLVNQEATREGIISAFKGFLIENLAIPKGSQILFHYSGHGSQMRNTTGTEPDGLDETIVPHDSRVGVVFDIPDKTLAGLIDRLAAAKGENITVILDSCHSGSGTREIRPVDAAPTRRAPADPRMPPPDLDADLRPKASTRGAARSGWAVARANHVLVAGCLDREESNEYSTAEGIFHGALTYFSLEYLRQKPPGAAYADWHAYAMRRVNSFYPNQTPQCEGQRDRAIFGDAYVERDPFIPVKRMAGEDRITIEAGLLHGIHEGTELAIHPASVASKQNLPQPLATARVENVTATTSSAVFTEVPRQHLPKVIHALVTRQAYASIRQKVALMPAQGVTNERALQALREAILKSGGEGKPSPYLHLLEDPNQQADLRVTTDNGELTIKDDQGNALVTPQDFKQGGAVPVLRALESIARYRMVFDLSNRQPSELAGKFALRLRRCLHMEGGVVNEAEDIPSDPDEILTIPYIPEKKEWNIYAQEITNNSTRDVYAHLFILNSDFSIYRLYPASGQNELLKAGGKIQSGMAGSGGAPLELTLPGDKPGEERWDVSRERLKLIVTTSPCDLGILVQDPLSVPAQRGGTRREDAVSPFEELLEAVTSGFATRGKPYTITSTEDWATGEIPYTLVRVSQLKPLNAPKGSVDIGDGIVLEKPQGFEGKIAVSPLEEARRGVGDEPGLKLPPGLAGLQDIFQPIIRSGTRGLSGQPLVITLEADDASRSLITPENPLRLRVPDGMGADDFLPIAFDGEDYLPVGYGTGGGTVDIVRVPAPGAGGQPGRRGLGKAIKLFVYKKIGRHHRDIGLRYVENVNGMPKYGDVRKARFEGGDGVAVLVHGFLSDTRWMVRDVLPFLSSRVSSYKHFLTWDFESFGTDVEANGADLAAALRQQCGCGPKDGLAIDVYGHGLGCLVARCMVELSGGHEFVDRMVLSGPPNRGTTLATLSRGFTYLLSGLINNLSSIPFAGAIAWPFKELYEQGLGWKDITVDSDICRRLNGLDTPSNVPYLVLAGTNVLDQAQGTRLNRLAHKMLDRTLDAIFGEKEHDAVVAMRSMEGVRNGTYPSLTVRKLPCDHFSYFAATAAQTAIQKWIIQ